MVLEPKPGTYALILSCSTTIRVQIGRLGTMRLQPGYYVYLGSALGAGGLRARIAHHHKLSLRPHWHNDARRREHQWARVVRTMRDARAPLLEFGAYDCNCRSHLYFFKRCPSRTRFQRALESLAKRHPPVEEFEPVNLSRVRLGREHRCDAMHLTYGSALERSGGLAF
jgi:Uri superfamily endonuclease